MSIFSGKRHVGRMAVFSGALFSALLFGSGLAATARASDDEIYKGLKSFSEVIELIEKNYVDEVNAKDLVRKAIQGMVHGLDPHSSFMAPEELDELRVGTKGEFGGVGLSITLQDGFVTVISPIEGTPAFKAGIKTWDRIIKVDGAITRELRDAVQRMRGPKGSKVILTIMRRDAPKPIDFTLERDIIAVKSVKSFVLKPGYGYVWITNFQDNTTDDLLEALKGLESAEPPLKGLVLDLRDNPGGLLPQAIEVSDLFLEEGKILSIDGRLKKHSKEYFAQHNSVRRDYPLAVLINGGSASASEIVAGALQDNRRAVILGTTSFGKGSVQTVETLRDGWGLKMTIARYYTPSGRSIQAKGIEPDIVIKGRLLERFKPEEDADALKEKDLKNHLGAGPGQGVDEDGAVETRDRRGGAKGDSLTDPKGKPDSRTEEELFRQGPLTLEKLQADNQVMRALDILMGFGILKGSRP